MNIAFSSQALTYLVFVDLTRVRLRRPQGAFAIRLARAVPLLSTAAVAAIGLWHLGSRAAGRGSEILFVRDYRTKIAVTLYAAIRYLLRSGEAQGRSTTSTRSA